MTNGKKIEKLQTIKDRLVEIESLLPDMEDILFEGEMNALGKHLASAWIILHDRQEMIKKDT